VSSSIPIGRRLALSTIAVALALSTGSAIGQPVPPHHLLLNLTSQSNLTRTDCCCPGFTNGQTYPLGTATYGEVPFRHGTQAQYAFMGGAYCGSPPRQLLVQLNAPGTSTVRILLNSWGGCGTSGPVFTVRASLSDGTSRLWLLRNGQEYRDHNGGCPIDSVLSQQVWSNGFGQYIDMLTLRVESPGRALREVAVDSTDPWSVIAAPLVFGITVTDDSDCNKDGIADFGQLLDGTLVDANGDAIPDTCQQPTCQDADLVPDGFVNGADLGMLLGAWGPAQPATSADLNHDGNVDGADLGHLLGYWGACN
jgi:hypothetical protein